jgi:hypothetical protein
MQQDNRSFSNGNGRPARPLGDDVGQPSHWWLLV